MVIIYYCYGGTHSSVLAAAIHTGLLPVDKIPASREIMALPYFDKIPSKLIGNLYYYGKDKENNEVYVLGLGKARKISKNSLQSIIDFEEIDEDVKIVNTFKNLNLTVKIGGYISKRLNLVFPGRNIVIYGLQKTYHKYVQMVTKVKKKIGIA